LEEGADGTCPFFLGVGATMERPFPLLAATKGEGKFVIMVRGF
jgi:hypothetical protein